jgi:hypothetical protein
VACIVIVLVVCVMNCLVVVIKSCGVESLVFQLANVLVVCSV